MQPYNHTTSHCYEQPKRLSREISFHRSLASYYHYVKNLNVAVIDCDSPQHSLSCMRERDMQAIGRSDYFKQQIASQFERIQKKAYLIINATTDQAREWPIGSSGRRGRTMI